MENTQQTANSLEELERHAELVAKVSDEIAKNAALTARAGVATQT